jgi:hypothetical protein
MTGKILIFINPDMNLFFSTDIDISVPFSSYYVLKTHEGFHDGILSLLTNKKEIIFFDKDHPKKKKLNRPVLLQSLNYTDNHCDDCHRTNICLFEMKINHIYKDHKLSLWIVTQPQPTNLIDGTTYLIVRDQYDFHIRLGKLIYRIFFYIFLLFSN